jgi:hypothetical protein
MSDLNTPEIGGPAAAVAGRLLRWRAVSHRLLFVQLESEIFWEAFQNAICRVIGIIKRLDSRVDVTMKVKRATSTARSMRSLGRGGHCHELRGRGVGYASAIRF